MIFLINLNISHFFRFLFIQSFTFVANFQVVKLKLVENLSASNYIFISSVLYVQKGIILTRFFRRFKLSCNKNFQYSILQHFCGIANFFTTIRIFSNVFFYIMCNRLFTFKIDLTTEKYNKIYF